METHNTITFSPELCRPADDQALTPCVVRGVTLTAMGIRTERQDLSTEEFNCLFSASLSISRSANWLLGDTLNLADRQWGNNATGSKYEEAARKTGLSLNSIKQIALTCKAIPLERRHPDLSFTHHVEARCYSCNPDVQDKLLAQASEQRLNVKTMRKAIYEKAAETRTPEQQAENGENDDRPFGLIDLPERVSPDAPPMWDALKFVAWVAKQEPDNYDYEQCLQALELVNPIADYREQVQARLQELENRGKAQT